MVRKKGKPLRKPWMRTAILALGLLVLPGQAMAAKIVVDAGHGGRDPGAIGVNGLQEKTVNLDISRKLRDLLIQRGYEVTMTRDSDVYLTLKERVDFTKAQHADLFVSIHANSISSPGTRGAMVLYYDDAYPQSSYPASPEMRALTPQSRELATKVLNSLVQTAGLENRGIVPSAVYVVRMGNIPSILVETAFLSNPEDAALLASNQMRQIMAQGIASGIEAYLPPNIQFPDTRGHWAREAILRLNAQGVVEGVGKNFEPDRMLTRAEWMTLLGRIFDLPAAKPAGGACGDGGKDTVAGAVYRDGGCDAAQGAAAFRDVNAGHWAFADLDRAVKAGVLEGYPDGTLRPDQPVTRAEVAALFQRLAKLPLIELAPGSQRPFKDIPAGYWAEGEVAALKQAGWIDGVTAERFEPERSMTRAESAALIDRYIASRK
ncbi:N-acetylmuramoyl-L-alanine amidase [Paenibacillus naphthalenovorans]|uniref:N-acetylmuramoyl-L-alanine amidase n=3 Tax=Paenibacillus TaxID=44249 RepID=UPI000882DA9C|nr:N-acetylmuramoyl-L-alanine amidase [Paenibacillus naphthalenovorans]GCL72729.1 N-acetylmuramoyl-L-alanine amidase [Paenibacillus naphthalenovorans]SDI11605.1 N-acetylmuramoyl-L-alanine amidase [Paenibacillus naphthalenovorans]